MWPTGGSFEIAAGLAESSVVTDSELPDKGRGDYLRPNAGTMSALWSQPQAETTTSLYEGTYSSTLFRGHNTTDSPHSSPANLQNESHAASRIVGHPSQR